MVILILLLAALILLVVAAFGVASRVNLVYLAGACLVGTLLVPLVH